MSQTGETDGYSVEDHVQAILEHSKNDVDAVVVANDVIPLDVLLRYEKEETHPIIITEETHLYPIIEANLLDFKDGLVTHNPDKVAKLLDQTFFKE